MIKKYCLLFVLLVYSPCSHASIWGDIKECFSDVCNCGYSTIGESWNNGSLTRTFKPNPICPPWNRREGREIDNCLLQFEPPDKWTGFYLKHCAEETPSSSYFYPKIRIRIQSCNITACWSQSAVLNWDGDCVLWPTGYGLPLVRICARIAVPAVEKTDINQTGTPADPGYTVGKHLNKFGAIEDDLTYIDIKGETKSFTRPKICAYSDPGLVNLTSNTGVHIDALDWNPGNQPLHITTAIHPLIKILLFLIENAVSLPSAISSLLSAVGLDKIPGLGILQSILKGVGDILNLFADIFEGVLRAVGSLNGSVDGYQFGCVDLPMGPMPPPYCPKLGKFLALASTQKICNDQKDGIFIQSSFQPCVVSKLNNNIVNNVVRISLDNLVPLCRNGENTQSTDKCVTLNNQSISAKGAHILTAYRDAIKKCTGSGGEALCVNTMIPFSCNINNGCKDGFRIVYAQKIGDKLMPSAYYADDIPDCGPGSADKTTCQQIWGINIGEFVDVAIKFPKIQDQSDISALIKSGIQLTDNANINRNFSVSIVRATPSDNSSTPNDICVMEGEELVSCEPRVTKGYEIMTYQCGGIPELTCPNYNSKDPATLYYSPQFIASIVVKDSAGSTIDSTSTVVTPLSINTSPKPATGIAEATINLAGYDFTSHMAYISDDTYMATPFFGSNSLNPSTIYGKYKDNAKPYYDNGIVNDSAVYLSGLEYVNGKYIQGGSHGCISLKNTSKCIPFFDNTNCVLAKLTETDTIDCKVFQDKIASPQYQGLRICNSSDDSCKFSETISGKDGGITIYECNNSVVCYKNNRNGGVQVCQVSMDTANRVDPAPANGDVINKSDQHYVSKQNNEGKAEYPNNPDTNIPYTQREVAVRDKTSLELGLCTPIDIPKCLAITNPTNVSGYATWKETEIGKQAEGTCKPDYTPIDPNVPLQRYCLSDANNKKVAFEPLPANVGCKYNPPICQAINVADQNSGYATWPETEIKKQAEGTCQAGYTQIDPNVPLQRYCLSDANNKKVAFEPLPANVGCIEDKGLIFTYSNDGTTSIPHSETYDTSEKKGNLTLGNAETKLSNTMHCAKYDFMIPNTNRINSFDIIADSYFKDYLVVKVNDNIVYAGPETSSGTYDCDIASMTMDCYDINECSLFAECSKNGYREALPYQIGNIPVPRFSILNKLKTGLNNISVCVGVVGGGAIKINMQYKLK